MQKTDMGFAINRLMLMICSAENVDNLILISDKVPGKFVTYHDLEF